MSVDYADVKSSISGFPLRNLRIVVDLSARHSLVAFTQLMLDQSIFSSAVRLSPKRSQDILIEFEQVVVFPHATTKEVEMAPSTAYAQERRKEERRKEAKSLGNALRQIITAANSSMRSDELMQDFLVESAKAMECSSAADRIPPGRFSEIKVSSMRCLRRPANPGRTRTCPMRYLLKSPESRC